MKGREIDDSNWVCLTEEGLIGEIKKITHIASEQVKSVDSPEREKELCPEGKIVSKDSLEPLLPAEDVKAIDFAKLSKKLGKSSPKKEK